MIMKFMYCAIILSTLMVLSMSSDITTAVYGKDLDGMPAAFGDFNSDELTDVFALSQDSRTLKIMLASNEEPLLRSNNNLNCTFDDPISSVVPGDFDGDVFMDILITTQNGSTTNAYVFWGGTEKLNCDTEPLIRMQGQPLAIDYNQDMIIDLFGTDQDGKRTFWIFNTNRTAPTPIKPKNMEKSNIRMPHANAFLDLNNDFYPDLFITTVDSFEIWHGKANGFEYNRSIPMMKKNVSIIGQSLFMDIELTGKMDLIVPVCVDLKCESSAIMVYSENSNKWYDLAVDFTDSKNTIWGFAHDTNSHTLYINTITLRGGDFNMDGYPDLLATLQTPSEVRRSFLLENSKKESNIFNRTFEVKWNALSPFNTNETVMAVFYDFYQDGILDVILVEYKKSEKNPKDKYKTLAFKNSLDYDANFVKVMVLTGRTNKDYPILPGTIGQKKRTYGTNLPGPSISYKIITQDGSTRIAMAAQLPQSAHLALNLPFTTFGLGRTPNFIDYVTIGLANKSREFPQIIPNSQMVVIPNPITEPLRWKVQLFVTPSKLILLSAAALTATCGLITIIIGILYWKERREDKIEKLQEAHRFHFDAM